MNQGPLTHRLAATALLATVLVAGCASTEAPPDESEPVAAPETGADRPAAEPEREVTREDVRPSAPVTYTVRKGDTLWDIAARFLNDPWVWPEIWEVNPEIANPHLIFPGDVITLAWVDDEPRLIVDRPVEHVVDLPDDLEIRRLEPEIRRIPLEEAIEAISADAIRQFLRRPQVFARGELDRAPYIIGNYEGRMISASGDEVFARGLADTGARRFNVVRQAAVLHDPDTGEVLGYEAIHLGEARLLEGGDPARLRLEGTVREVLNGDRLMPAEYRIQPARYIPRTPEEEIGGRIVGLYDAITQVGSRQIVVINRGDRDGVEIGTVFGIEQSGGTVRDTYGNGTEIVELPRQRVGTLMVFETFERVSYALVMRATHPIREDDYLVLP